MSIPKLENILITEDDISWVESLMGADIHFNDSQKAVIKNLDSIDIQAFPGSGKTTTLVAKLAILARKWPYANCGICVLSHTNVAREEIENRLGNTAEGAKLLSYPHFIGTLHSFFNTYVALPAIRSEGIKLNMIDTDRVQSLRWSNLSYGTRSYLERQHKNESICGYVNEWGCIGWKKGEKTCNDILCTIKQSQEMGYFTYDEMLLKTKKFLTDNPNRAKAIEERFPVVFIDEAQDTNSLLWDLIDMAFPQNGELSIRQGYGDSNQAIYNYFNETVAVIDFPRPSHLVLSESKRFDGRIAALANSVALSSENMLGTPNEYTEKEIPHTIFLFDKNTAPNVIIEFSKLILACFSEDEIRKNKKSGIHVIGMVHNKMEETPDRHFPKGIYDYWPEYIPDATFREQSYDSFVEYYRQAKRAYSQTEKYTDLINWLAKGFRRIINLAANENLVPASGNPLLTIEKNLLTEDREIFRAMLLEMAKTNIIEEKQWNDACLKVKDLLRLFNLSANRNVCIFLKWRVPTPRDIENEGYSSSQVPTNRYIYKDENTGRSVELEFGSIHSVKGCTHFATLILETYSKAHNMKSILKYLSNNRPKANPNTTNSSRLKCQYVAMSRAKALLCLAIPAAFVDDVTQKSLIESGWTIKDIRQ